MTHISRMTDSINSQRL